MMTIVCLGCMYIGNQEDTDLLEKIQEIIELEPSVQDEMIDYYIF